MWWRRGPAFTSNEEDDTPAANSIFGKEKFDTTLFEYTNSNRQEKKRIQLSAVNTHNTHFPTSQRAKIH